MIREVRVAVFVSIKVLRRERLRAAQGHRSCLDHVAGSRRRDSDVAAATVERTNRTEQAGAADLSGDHHVRSQRLIRVVVVGDVSPALRINIDRRKLSETAVSGTLWILKRNRGQIAA